MKLLAVGAAATILLTGCSASAGDYSGADSGASTADMAWETSGDGAMREMELADAAAADEMTRESDLPTDVDYLVRWASMDVKVDDVTESAARVRSIASAAGGVVTSEQFGDDRFYGSSQARSFGSISISVPSEKLDEVLDDLAQVGEVRSRSTESTDVKDEYIDVEARIKTLTASIDRMRDLMSQTDDIKQIIELETALSARQADLDSLQARMNDLKGRIAMSPVHVSLSTGDDPFYEEPGIGGAFKKAWNDFKASATVLVRAAGALLPWILVGGAAAWALFWGARRTKTRRATTSAGTDAPASQASAPAEATPTEAAPTLDEPAAETPDTNTPDPRP